jgi:Rad3-related DNA helicase
VWADAIICDYNYVFDPQVYLRRHFAEDGGAYGFLVDEAHNLVDRAREMFSADLDGREILDVKRAIKKAAPRCAKASGSTAHGDAETGSRRLKLPKNCLRPPILPSNSICFRRRP